MGRRGGHAHKRPRTLARDFKTPREDVWQPGSGSERPGRTPGDGNAPLNWALTTDDMNNEGFEAYYKARSERVELSVPVLHAADGCRCQRSPAPAPDPCLAPQAQKIVPEGEWEAFMQCLRTPLPATFRIAGAGKHAAAVLSTLRTDFVNVIASLGSVEPGSEEPPQPPVSLPWCVPGGARAAARCECSLFSDAATHSLPRYPGELAWQMNYSRTQVWAPVAFLLIVLHSCLCTTPPTRSSAACPRWPSCTSGWSRATCTGASTGRRRCPWCRPSSWMCSPTMSSWTCAPPPAARQASCWRRYTRQWQPATLCLPPTACPPAAWWQTTRTWHAAIC